MIEAICVFKKGDAMSKKQLSGSRVRPRAGWRKRRVAALITLALVCVISTSLLAQVDLQGRGKRTSGEVSVMSLSGPPAKEYIYAGSKLVATVEPTAVGGNDAEFVSMSAREDFENPPIWMPIGTGSPFGMPGQTYIVRVTMLNTGANTWTAGNYKLGSQNPANNNTWGLTRINVQGSVPHGQTATFEFGAAKPVGFPPDYFNFQWQMVQDGGVGYFGEKTKNGIVFGGSWLPLGGAPNYANFVSQSVPDQMAAGQTYTVSITMNNAGTNWWLINLLGVPESESDVSVRLGAQIPQDNMTWGDNRVPLPSSVSPGQNVTFTFDVTAPSTPGEYNFQWMMVLESEMEQQMQEQWFGTLTPTTFVNVTSP
jgi:hypothetical protein